MAVQRTISIIESEEVPAWLNYKMEMIRLLIDTRKAK